MTAQYPGPVRTLLTQLQLPLDWGEKSFPMIRIAPHKSSIKLPTRNSSLMHALCSAQPRMQERFPQPIYGCQHLWPGASPRKRSHAHWQTLGCYKIKTRRTMRSLVQNSRILVTAHSVHTCPSSANGQGATNCRSWGYHFMHSRLQVRLRITEWSNSGRETYKNQKRSTKKTGTTMTNNNTTNPKTN